MSHTIMGKFFPTGAVNDTSKEDTIDYLKQLGMTFRRIENVVFYIELQQIPDIIFKLIKNGYLDICPDQTFDILKISNNGVALYVSTYVGGDGYVFLSNDKIISLHTVSEEFLQTIKHDLE